MCKLPFHLKLKNNLFPSLLQPSSSQKKRLNNGRGFFLHSDAGKPPNEEKGKIYTQKGWKILAKFFSSSKSEVIYQGDKYLFYFVKILLKSEIKKTMPLVKTKLSRTSTIVKTLFRTLTVKTKIVV